MASQQCTVGHRLSRPGSSRLQIKSYNIFSQSNNDFGEFENTNPHPINPIILTNQNELNESDDSQQQGAFSLKELTHSQNLQNISLISQNLAQTQISILKNNEFKQTNNPPFYRDTIMPLNTDLKKVFQFLQDDSASVFVKTFDQFQELRNSRTFQRAQDSIKVLIALSQEINNYISQSLQNLVQSINKDLCLLHDQLEKYFSNTGGEILQPIQGGSNKPHVIGSKGYAAAKTNQNTVRYLEKFQQEVGEIFEQFLELTEKHIQQLTSQGGNSQTTRRAFSSNNESEKENSFRLVNPPLQSRELSRVPKLNNGELDNELDNGDDYDSDFSDDNFDIQSEQEKIALQLVAELKERVEDPAIYREIQEILQNQSQNYVYVFHDILNQDLDMKKTEIQIDCLLERLNYSTSCAGETKFDQQAVQLLFQRISTQNMGWFQDRITQDSLEVNYANFSFQRFNSKNNPRRDLTLSVLIEQLQTYNATNNINEFTKEQNQVYASISNKTRDRSFLLQREIREMVLDFQYPLSRKQCQILFSILDYSGTGKVEADDLVSVLLENPPIIFEICDLLPPYKDENQLLDSLEARALELMQKIKQKLNQRKIDKTQCVDIFRLKDRALNNRLSLEVFSNCCSENCFPLDKHEIQLLFRFLHESESGQPLRLRNMRNLTNSKIRSTGRDETTPSFNSLNSSTSNEPSATAVGNQTYENDNSSNNVNDSFKNRIGSGNDDSQKSNRSLATTKPSAHSLHAKYSVEQTAKVQMDFLEHENALLRKKSKQKDEELSALKQCIVNQEAKIQELEFQQHDEIEAINERNLNFIRDNFLHKEMEQNAVLIQQFRKSEIQIEMLKRKFQTQKNELKRIIQNQNDEIHSYRIELQGILNELESERRTQRLGNGNQAGNY